MYITVPENKIDRVCSCPDFGVVCCSRRNLISIINVNEMIHWISKDVQSTIINKQKNKTKRCIGLCICLSRVLPLFFVVVFLEEEKFFQGRSFCLVKEG